MVEEIVEPKIIESAILAQRDRLKQGGKLMIYAFTPGEGVAAGETTDQIALNIIKGLTESIRSADSPIEVLTVQSPDRADLVIMGRVTYLDQTQKWKSWVGMNAKILKASGRLVDQSNHQVILDFAHEIKAGGKRVNFDAMARELGEDIGRYIVRAAK